MYEGSERQGAGVRWVAPQPLQCKVKKKKKCDFEI